MTNSAGVPSNPNQMVETLKVHPSVVFKLGEDLITDEIQALVELVKNSYDADSSWVRLNIYTKDEGVGFDGLGNRDPEQRTVGYLTIEDGGTGMTPSAIVSGWLTVSNSWKRAFKEEGKVTDKGRTPLGDKGLGRLGSQRLGDYLEIETRPAGTDDAWAVSIPWRAYESVDTLDAVQISVRPIPRSTAKPGTKLTIIGLSPRFVELATNENLSIEMSKMISPFEGDKDFELRVRLNGERLDLRALSAQVRKAAEVHYGLTYNQGILRVQLRLDYRILKSNQPGQAGKYGQWIEPDKGASFFDWLMHTKGQKASSFGISGRDDKGGIVGSYQTEIFDHADLKFVDKVFVDPGPFVGEIEAVDLDEDRTGAFRSRTEYTRYVREIGGVRIYRDGFAVRTDLDWLGLSKRWSTGRSYYGIRPNTVIGYVNLTARENEQLRETTNREGFQKTPALANFNRIMNIWLDYTDRVQEFIRRAYLDFIRDMESTTELDSRAPVPPEEAANRITRVLKQTADLRTNIVEMESSVSTILRGGAANDPNVSPTFPIITDQETDEVLGRIAALSLKMDDFFRDVNLAERDLETIRLSIEATKIQLADAWQTVAVGLAAESVVHEIRNVLDSLKGRTQSLRKRISTAGATDTATSIYLEHVDSAMRALNRQLSHVEPGLRYVRDKRENIVIGSFVTEYKEFYADAWNGQHDPKFNIAVNEDFSIRANRGRLTQVLDNMVLNSRYWLTELSKRSNRAGTIDIRIERPFVYFSDNGPGISPSIETLLFDPFVTLKPTGEGRGLGLFVVKQLLDADSAEIVIGPERDSDGRFRSFRIDFSEALTDDHGA